MQPCTPCRSFAFSACVIALALIATPVALAQTFSNTTRIAMNSPTASGPAVPYPSSIAVSGAPTSIDYVSVTLNGFTHTWISDVNVLLVSPTGQKILLMANCNGSADAFNNTLTFIPDGTQALPSENVNMVSGYYACSVYTPPDSLPAPAPAGPYATSLAPLIGTNPNGTWDLYVYDDTIGDPGAFQTGWSISFGDTTSRGFTYQGRLVKNDVPVTGVANVRFTLCGDATSPTTASAVAPAITRGLSDIADGLIVTTLDFGGIINTNRALWLNIEVESPPGSGFVTLTPRQPITPAPQARISAFAANAANAYTANNLAPTNGMQLNTSITPLSPYRFAFGSVGNLLGTAENSDAFYFQRINSASNNTDLRLYIGDDPSIAPGAGGDAFSIWTNTGSAGSGLERMRFQSDGNALKPGGGSWTALSDPRAKHDIAPLVGTLEKLLSLHGYSFLYNEDRIAQGLARPGPQMGLMADEVARVFPDWVSTDASGTRYVTERATTALMVEALRDLRAEKDAAAAMTKADLAAAQAQIDALKADAAKRDAEHEALKARLEAIEATLSNASKDNR